MDTLPTEGSQSRKRQHTFNPLDSPPADAVEVVGLVEDPDSSHRRFQLLQELSKRPFLIGDTWHLVSKKWYRKWLDAHDPSSTGTVNRTTLGPVDNSDLFESSGGANLRRPLINDLDVVFVPEEGWANLENWYGKSEHPLPRKVVGCGQSLTPIIETHPFSLRIHRIVKNQTAVLGTPPSALEISETSTLASLCRQAANSVRGPHQRGAAARVYILADHDARWKLQIQRCMVVYYGYKLLEPSAETLAESGIKPNDHLAVDLDMHSDWILDQATSTSTSSSPFPEPRFFGQSEDHFYQAPSISQYASRSQVIINTPIRLHVHRIVKDQVVILATPPGIVELSETDTLVTLRRKAADSVRGAHRGADARVYILADPDDEWRLQLLNAVGRGWARSIPIVAIPNLFHVHRIVKDQMVILPTPPSAVELLKRDTSASLCHDAADTIRGPPRRAAEARVYRLAEPHTEWKVLVQRKIVDLDGYKSWIRCS
ncbi:hypothetical protein DL96DRAFT_1678300 [Flagelloscypha sp. PMI_526]|nr:hypothetical protein DL96DRAFT_1678300 [Flagelloscypha sp. PMI_526]